MPAGVTQHRNVIFRNDDVIDSPITAIDISRVANPDPEFQITPPSLVGNPDPTILWSGLEEECNDAPGRCEALVIPHNTNLSSRAGITRTVMHVPGETESERQKNAELMVRMQPLVEIFQIKGASECRYDPRFADRYADTPWLTQTGLNPLDTPDEYCDFELLDSKGGGAAAGLISGGGEATAPDEWTDRAFMRNVFKDGLLLKDRYGVNPFQVGIGSSQDDHNGRPGFVPENKSFNGHTGVGDAFTTRDAGTIQNNSGGLWVVWAEENSRDSIFTGLKKKETYGTSGTRPKVRFFGGWEYSKNLCRENFVHTGVGDAFTTRDAGTIQNNSGGLWVVWAEENSRDSIFTGLKKKETYGTSGTRPKVRFFGGWEYSKNLCRENFVRQGYEKGVPMGSTLPLRRNNQSPRFIAAAWKDDGPGAADLQRIQIIKGWVDEQGETRESVYTVAITDGEGAAIKDTVPPEDSGSEHLCTVWEDPDFNASHKAFYYARVLENPVIRYSTDICQAQGIDPTATQEECKQQLADYSSDFPTDYEQYPGLAVWLKAERSFQAGNYSQCCARAGDRPDQTPFVQPVIQERAWTSPIWYYPSS